MPALVLGPILRRVGPDYATVWVETDAPGRVEVLGHSDRTFTVEGHHYALVCVGGLAPREIHPYEVRLDGDQAWPPRDYEFPLPSIRTLGGSGPFQVVFGSCRVALPHRPPYTLPKDEHPDGREFDALYTLAHELLTRPREDWPDLLLMLGDQVYVDEGSPAVRERIRATRDTSRPPGEEVAGFEEYTWLYHESWGDPTIRWLLSTIPTAMVIDDHDMADDWNISRSWKEEMRARPWWRERVAGGLMTYWIYQHIGNLAPSDLDQHKEFAAVRGAGAGDGDGAAALRNFVEWVDSHGEGKVWSFKWDLGNTRLVVVDDRTGRQFKEGRRSIFDDHEWRWIEEAARGEFDHLMFATTDPVLLAPALHYAEAWSEAVCDGAWGRRAVAVGEKLRRALDLDHWAAFHVSFELLERLLREIGSGQHGKPPASIVLLSGDVHNAYLAEVAFRGACVRSAVYQAVCSPFRNALDAHERHVLRAALTRPAVAAARALARAAGARDPDIRWRITEGPFFDNQVATITVDGRRATLKLEKTVGDPGSDARSLETVFERQLAWPEGTGCRTGRRRGPEARGALRSRRVRLSGRRTQLPPR
jgi:PhoD-like phosphatase